MRVLVVAKSPVAGRVKTRLGSVIGLGAAADVAAAALLDTLETAAEAVGAEQCHLALAGEPGEAVRGREIRRLLAGWTVTSQRGDDFPARLAAAHLDAGTGPVAQIGMDTPQLRAADLERVFAELSDHDAVLGPAEDGGWWVLGRHDPQAAQWLAGVAMSQPTTYDDTRAALEAQDLLVGSTGTLRDVDTVADAEAVAAAAPDSRFAQAWWDVAEVVA
ncbi:MAG: DUF2064 domain-containing protein [Actinomycetota bacterium]|nr:DUF2064 domain-containing protein [Actinomycetota bacterium]